MTQKELNEILELHKMWLEGKGGERADLTDVDLSGEDLSGADLSDADLSDADLFNANLSYANLSNTNLSGANLNGTNLSNTKGLIDPIDYLDKNFEKTEGGYIVYKTFGQFYDVPSNWKIKPNYIIEEEVNYNRSNNCGCGINIATKQWVELSNTYYRLPIWKLLIKWEWLPSVVVPYNTNGKIRCGKAMLLEEIKI